MQERVVKTQKKISIVETHERSIVLRRAQGAVVWCGQCGDNQLMVHPEMAAALSCLTVGVIYEMMDDGRLHGREEGIVTLICGASIQRAWAAGL
jgi:hypothetical protein